MPVRFAVAAGNWNTGATWDNGSVPVAGDTVYPNGFTVTIDTDINVASLDNNTPPVVLPNMNIPAMTSNTQPSGIADSSGNATTYAPYLVFDQNSSTSYRSNTNNACWITYEYPSARLIKRYYLRSIVVSGYGQPASWVFEGWNGTSWDPLESKSAMGTSTQTGYTSPILTHTTLYSKYRLNITVGSSVGFPISVSQFELGESTGTIYGTGTGGTFTVPASLSGIRNIVQTGAGIVSNNVSTSGIVQTNHIAGNIVNFNTQPGGYIINPQWVTGNTSNVKAVAINGNGTVNFNGNIWGHTGVIYNDTLAASIFINANATVTINGNVYAPAGNATSESYTILSAVTTSTSATLNINGDIIGSGTTIRSFAILLNSALTLNIVGNLTSNKGYCLQSSYNNIINITGTATVTDSISVNAIYMLGTSPLITMNGSITNKGNSITIWAAKLRFAATATPAWIFQTDGASDITLSYGTASGTYPLPSNVKLGITYGQNPTLTGTCAVPLPQYVSQGVPTGSTVGTAYLSASDVWNILTSTIATSGSIGELILNNLNATISSRATQTSVDTINTNINTANTNINTANTNINTINGKVDVTLSTRASQTSVDTANTNINNLPTNTSTSIWNAALSAITTSGTIGKLIKDNIDSTISSRSTQTSVNNIPSDVITALNTSTDPIAERLRIVSTVNTTGDQLAAFL